jgi:hypothetical protein
VGPDARKIYDAGRVHLQLGPRAFAIVVPNILSAFALLVLLSTKSMCEPDSS